MRKSKINWNLKKITDLDICHNTKVEVKQPIPNCENPILQVGPESNDHLNKSKTLMRTIYLK